MANTTTSPNMGLVVPTVSVDPGPDWANNINASLSIVDQHNHSSGSGVQINPAGININSDLPFNGNNLTLVRSTRFSVQPAALSGVSDLGCLYVTGVDLYYNDENGNQIQLTAGGTVNATSSGISSGTASASFIGGTLVVNSASNTPANVQCGSVLIGNVVAASKFCTLSVQNSLASNYALTLPTIPVSTSFVTIDSSGNMGTSSGVSAAQIASGSITGSQIATQTVAQSNLALRSTGTTVGAGGVAISNAAVSFITNSTSYVSVTNLSVTITTTGRPVFIGLQNTTTSSTQAYIFAASSETGFIELLRGSTSISTYSYQGQVPPPTCMIIDAVSSGTYTYSIKMKSGAGGNVEIQTLSLIAYEI